MTYKLLVCEVKWMKDDFIRIFTEFDIVIFVLAFMSAILILYLGSLYFPKILMIIVVFSYILWFYEAYKECKKIKVNS